MVVVQVDQHTDLWYDPRPHIDREDGPEPARAARDMSHERYALVTMLSCHSHIFISVIVTWSIL